MEKYRLEFTSDNLNCENCPINKEKLNCSIEKCPLQQIDINSHRNLSCVERGKYNLLIALKGEVYICEGKVVSEAKAEKLSLEGKRVVHRELKR